MQGDLGDSACIRRLLQTHRPRALINFAAESHVDRSIDGPAAYVETNVLGTFRLLEETRTYWQTLPETKQQEFHSISPLLTKHPRLKERVELIRGPATHHEAFH